MSARVASILEKMRFRCVAISEAISLSRLHLSFDYTSPKMPEVEDASMLGKAAPRPAWRSGALVTGDDADKPPDGKEQKGTGGNNTKGQKVKDDKIIATICKL
eukprot:4336905-Pyramimonas_sp.AAC.1